METFDYLSVLLSIILGLAITQVLLGFRGLILARVRVKIYLPTLIRAGLALLIAIQAWWDSFGLRTRGTWNFLAFFVVLQTISVYMATAVVLPDMSRESALPINQDTVTIEGLYCEISELHLFHWIDPGRASLGSLSISK
jgi:hypothetical protein